MIHWSKFHLKNQCILYHICFILLALVYQHPNLKDNIYWPYIDMFITACISVYQYIFLISLELFYQTSWFEIFSFNKWSICLLQHALFINPLWHLALSSYWCYWTLRRYMVICFTFDGPEKIYIRIMLTNLTTIPALGFAEYPRVQVSIANRFLHMYNYPYILWQMAIKTWHTVVNPGIQTHLIIYYIKDDTIHTQIKFTFESLTVRGQQHSFSTHERMFLWKCQSF